MKNLNSEKQLSSIVSIGEKYSAEKLSENLSKLLNENKISINQLHKNTGVALATIKRIKYDKDANPTISSLLPIAEFFSISINQLLGIEPLTTEHLLGVYTEQRMLWTKVPVITWEESIKWPEGNSYLKPYDFISTDIEVGEDVFALIVKEENWSPFSKGTKLIFDPEKQAKHRNYVLVFNRDLISVSFYQLLIFDGVSYLKPPQNDYKTIEYDKNKHIIKATLVQARMDQE